MPRVFLMFCLCISKVLYAQNYKDQKERLFDHLVEVNPILLGNDTTDYIMNRSTFAFAKGNYRSAQAAEIERLYNLSFYGKTQLKNQKTILFGKIDSRFASWSQSKWNHSHSNDWMSLPYQVVSNVSRDWKKYFYKLKGGLIYQNSDHIFTALKFIYSPYNDYRIRDPRTQITGLKIGISPSIAYQFNRGSKILLQYTYASFKEMNHTHYKEQVLDGVMRLLMLGYGYYNTLPDNVYLLKGVEQGISASYSRRYNATSLYASLNYKQSHTDVQRKLSYVEEYPIIASYRWNKIEASVLLEKSSGHSSAYSEFVFSNEQGEGHTLGRTNQKNYKSSRMSLSYFGIYDFFERDVRLNFRLQCLNKSKIDKQSVHTFEFTDMFSYATIDKSYKMGAGKVFAGAGASYKQNLSADLEIALLQKNNVFNSSVVPHDHEYYASSFIAPEIFIGFKGLVFSKEAKVQFTGSGEWGLNAEEFKHLPSDENHRLYFTTNFIISL